jgi:hypothetical protein
MFDRKNGFLQNLARLNITRWGKNKLNYHRLSRKNLQSAPEYASKKSPQK